MRALVLALACAVGIGACSRTSVTARYFADHRADFVKTRDMIRSDGTRVRSVAKAPLGNVRSASSDSVSCGSTLRGGELPWTCTGGRQAQSLAEAESILGWPPGRLHEYETALPAKSFTRDVETLPPGAILFWLVDPDAAPCTGMVNVVWSEKPPAAPAYVYRALGDGFYEQACATAPN